MTNMALSAFSCSCKAFLYILFFLVFLISADPEPMQDFCIASTDSANFQNGLPCTNPIAASPANFKTSDLGIAGNTSANPWGFALTLTTPQNLPGVNTMGMAMARIDIGVGGVVAPHAHPRATEIVFVMEGTLSVGFVDTTNKLFSTRLEAGDVFIFPKALVHFLYNVVQKPAVVIAGLNSQNPGAYVLPLTTFATTPAMPTQVLEKAFQISSDEVEKIRKNLGGT